MIPFLLRGLFCAWLALPFTCLAREIHPSDDDSHVTSDAEQQTAIVGTGTSAQQKIVLKIPVGERLRDASVSCGKWITGVTLTFSDTKHQTWEHKKNDKKWHFILKEGEYVTGVKVHLDSEENVDWMDFLTNQNRLLHFGQPKISGFVAGIYDLNIPPHSRLTALTLYVGKGKQLEVDGISVGYQRVNWQ